MKKKCKYIDPLCSKKLTRTKLKESKRFTLCTNLSLKKEKRRRKMTLQ
jgi:hypothetical protein